MPSNQDVPEIYASYPFANATLQSLGVHHAGKVASADEDFGDPSVDGDSNGATKAQADETSSSSVYRFALLVTMPLYDPPVACGESSLTHLAGGCGREYRTEITGFCMPFALQRMFAVVKQEVEQRVADRVGMGMDDATHKAASLRVTVETLPTAERLNAMLLDQLGTALELEDARKSHAECAKRRLQQATWRAAATDKVTITTNVR